MIILGGTSSGPFQIVVPATDRAGVASLRHADKAAANSQTPRATGLIMAERLRELVNYDPVTGFFSWRVRRGQAFKPGMRCGSIDSAGHRQIEIDGRPYGAHRLAWLYMNGHWPEDQIDHRNGVRDDNRWENLRPADQSRNSANSKRPAHNISGFKGVTVDKRRGRFGASIKVRGERIWLGTFDTPQEAHEVYCRAAKEGFGDYARFE